MNKEFSIMESNLPYYHNERFYGSERHEIFFGKNRKKSIEDGLVVFITPQEHKGTNGIHGKNGSAFNLKLKQIGQKAWCDYYKKTNNDFIKRYGKNYL